MNVYENIADLLKRKPKLIDDIVKLNNSNVKMLEMSEYDLQGYFKEQDKNRDIDGMVNSIQEIQLLKWVYEIGTRQSRILSFEDFLKILINDEISYNSEDNRFRDSIIYSYSNALSFCRDIKGEDNSIKRICSCDIREVFDYINIKEK